MKTKTKPRYKPDIKKQGQCRIEALNLDIETISSKLDTLHVMRLFLLGKM